MLKDFEHNKNTVCWKYKEKEIKLQLKNIILSYENKKNEYIKVEIGQNFEREKYLYYDYNGNLIMESNIKEEYIWWKYNEKEEKIKIENLLITLLSIERRVIVVQYRVGKLDKAFILNLEGDFLYDITPPEGFRLWYFSDDQEGIRVACDGIKKYADSYGRTSYWFLIDLETGRLTKQGLAY